MENNRIAVEVNYLDENGDAGVAYFSNAPLVSNDNGALFGNLPDDVICDPRIAANPRIREQVGDGVTDATGVLELVNTDGALDDFYKYSFDGQTIKFVVESQVYRSDPGNVTSVCLYGMLEQPEFTDTRVILKFRAHGNARLEQQWPFGTLSGIGGIHGGSDMAGKVLPQLWGKCKQIPLVPVDPANLIYLVCDVRDFGTPAVYAVYDAGVALTAGANYISTADLTNNAPAAGQYRVLLASWGANAMYVRLGSSPVGQVTADAVYSTSNVSASAQITLGYVLDAMLRYAFDVLGGPIDNRADLDALAGGEVAGVYLDRNQTIREVAAATLKGVRGWLTPQLRYPPGFKVFWPMDPSILTDGALTPHADIDGADIIKSGRTSSVPSNFTSLPAQQVQVDYERVWTVQTSGLAGSVSATMRSYLGTEYRRATATSTTIPASYPSSGIVNSPTPWVPTTASNMAIEATRQLDALGVRRDVIQLRCRLTPLWTWFTNGLGGPVNVVNYARFGCDVSRKFMTIGFDIDLATGVADLLLWG